MDKKREKNEERQRERKRERDRREGERENEINIKMRVSVGWQCSNSMRSADKHAVKTIVLGEFTKPCRSWITLFLHMFIVVFLYTISYHNYFFYTYLAGVKVRFIILIYLFFIVFSILLYYGHSYLNKYIFNADGLEKT